MADRELQVYIDQTRIGALREGGGIWRFLYDTTWAEAGHSFPISPGLPFGNEILDTGTHRPVQWFFDNLLPEDELRKQLAKEMRIKGADAFALLEAYGYESAGALTLLEPGKELPVGGRIALNDDHLFQRIRDLPRQSLEAKAPKKMSLAGAQHKLPVIVDGDDLYEPEGSEPSTHILKVNHRNADHYPHTTANEWFTMRLAGRTGLDVPTTTHRYCPRGKSSAGHEAIFIIDRFDRTRAEGEVRRLHSIDACQLLSVDRAFKYSAMSVDSLKRVADATRKRALSRLRLFEWVAFNAIVGNADAHLKNLSFLVDSEGIDLAPHYDLLSTAVFDTVGTPGKWKDVPMSLPIGKATTFAEITREDFAALAEALGITRDGWGSILDRLISKIPVEADALLETFRASPHPETAAPARGGEVRVLRQIRAIPIVETIARLR